jgi:hypothetical protein
VPILAPPSDELLYARPDDYSDHGKTWRQVLVEYNRLDANPRSLLPAHQLYCDAVYARLARHIGLQNLYILSAGWGRGVSDARLRHHLQPGQEG